MQTPAAKRCERRLDHARPGYGKAPRWAEAANTHIVSILCNAKQFEVQCRRADLSWMQGTNSALAAHAYQRERAHRSPLFGDTRALETEHHFTFDPREPRVKLSHKLGLN